jgi:hypothetical protein
MPTSFVDFFDVTNIEHLKAYKFLQTYGYLPEGFVPLGVEMSQLWQVVVADKLANAYLASKGL